MSNYMMITFDAEEDRTAVTFCDIYPKRDRGLAESQGLYVEIYRRVYDKEMGTDNYVRFIKRGEQHMAKYHRTNMDFLKDAIKDLQENGSDLEYWNVNAMAKREGYTVKPKKSSFVITNGKQSREYKFKDAYTERIWQATAGRRDMQASWAAKREKDLREANAAMHDLWNRL